MISRPPEETKAEPAVVTRLARGRPVRAVWLNELGGVTYEIGEVPRGGVTDDADRDDADRDDADRDDADRDDAGRDDADWARDVAARSETAASDAATGRCFVKWAPAGSGLDLRAEATRMEWAAAFTPVPRPLDLGENEDGAWLVTAALPGASAVDPRWLAEPKTAVRALGEGLRALHEALPVDACPFSWEAAPRVADARERARDGLVDVRRWHPIHRQIGLDRALELLSDIPPPDHRVVCHGDSCAPNTLLTDDGRWSGHVDLATLGTADRWADLAVGTWSTEWNYGPGWEDELLAAYGVAPDDDRTRYYRLLWDLGP